MKNTIVLFIFCCVGITSLAQEKFKVVYLNDDYTTHYLADEKDSILRKLDSSYVLAYQPDILAFFHVFAKSGVNGWSAININETILFKVYNTEIGTPSPDDLINGFVRIEKDSLIGFANEFGEIVIEPQFEIATSFENDFAIIGEKCKRVPWDKNHCEQECNHYSTVCERHGYIDLNGKILELGNFTYQEIEELIKNNTHNTK